MVNRLTPSGMHRAVEAGRQEPGEPRVEPVHPQEAQVDQRGHPQAHMVDPDQDPDGVEGEQVDEDLKLQARKASGDRVASW